MNGNGLDTRARLECWTSLGANEAQAAELVAYAASPVHTGPLPSRSYPLEDAACVAAWRDYVAEAAEVGVEAVLRRVFVQLAFPVRAGMSLDACYHSATRRGVVGTDCAGVRFANPAGLHVCLHPTPAGQVPVVLAEARADFEALVQALTLRNEPETVPASMGACMVAGYNNWERVGALRRAFEAEHPEDWSGEAWKLAWRGIVPQQHLYQDRFMLLSAGPYSATPALALGLDDVTWHAASIQLRLEHECTHYFTRQAFGSMRKSMLDELVADYLGLVLALGQFHPSHFLRFMGLEDFPAYRAGGRLQNYRGTPPLSDGAFAVLPRAVVRAAENLARIDFGAGGRPLGLTRKAAVITSLMRVGLEGLASPRAADFVTTALSEAALGAAAT